VINIFADGLFLATAHSGKNIVVAYIANRNIANRKKRRGGMVRNFRPSPRSNVGALHWSVHFYTGSPMESPYNENASDENASDENASDENPAMKKIVF
jgi:hypothetical protein